MLFYEYLFCFWSNLWNRPQICVWNRQKFLLKIYHVSRRKLRNMLTYHLIKKKCWIPYFLIAEVIWKLKILVILNNHWYTTNWFVNNCFVHQCRKKKCWKSGDTPNGVEQFQDFTTILINMKIIVVTNTTLICTIFQTIYLLQLFKILKMAWEKAVMNDKFSNLWDIYIFWKRWKTKSLKHFFLLRTSNFLSKSNGEYFISGQIQLGMDLLNVSKW